MLVSICIPTYNSGEKLVRLLNSIHQQTYTNYEIIISDDSRNNNVQEIITTQFSHLPIKYFWNEKPLGTPNNWNNAVNKSNGDWINLMHHDDWFAGPNTLSTFIKNVERNTKAIIIFSAFENNYTDKGTTKVFTYSFYELLLLKFNYLNLYKTFLPNPSCTLINKKFKPYSYDKTFKWLIDFDFYTCLFKENTSFICINKPLIKVGMHSGQVTASVFQNPAVEIPESIALIQKHGTAILKNIYVYDFFWRLYRNINIRSIQEFNSYCTEKCTVNSLNNIINFQSKINVNILKIGVVSKPLMFISYLKNLFT